MNFTKEKFKKAFSGLLVNEVFPHHFGASLVDVRKPDEVLIEDDLQRYL